MNELFIPTLDTKKTKQWEPIKESTSDIEVDGEIECFENHVEINYTLADGDSLIEEKPLSFLEKKWLLAPPRQPYTHQAIDEGITEVKIDSSTTHNPIKTSQFYLDKNLDKTDKTDNNAITASDTINNNTPKYDDRYDKYDKKISAVRGSEEPSPRVRATSESMTGSRREGIHPNHQGHRKFHSFDLEKQNTSRMFTKALQNEAVLFSDSEKIFHPKIYKSHGKLRKYWSVRPTVGKKIFLEDWGLNIRDFLSEFDPDLENSEIDLIMKTANKKTIINGEEKYPFKQANNELDIAKLLSHYYVNQMFTDFKNFKKIIKNITLSNNKEHKIKVADIILTKINTLLSKLNKNFEEPYEESRHFISQTRKKTIKRIENLLDNSLKEVLGSFYEEYILQKTSDINM